MAVMHPIGDRAQAIGILRMFLSLFVGAIVIWIVNLTTSPLFEVSEPRTDDQVSSQGADWLQQGLDYLPVLFLGIAFFGLIAYSVYRREVIR